MKRLFLAICLLILFALLAMTKEARRAEEHKPEKTVSTAPAAEEKSAAAEPKPISAAIAAAEHAPAANILAPRRYFPDAKVLSRVEQRDAKGSLHVIKTVETSLKEPYVIVEEVFEGAEAPTNLVEQSAMVANQLLVAPVEGVTEERLIRAIQDAGAVEVRKSGVNYLATFPALPDDPRAVENFKARLIASADFELVIEPNYIRKIF